MAVTLNKDKTALAMVVFGEMKANGEYARKTIRFNTIRPTATDDAVYSVATGFASLISSKVGDIRREDGGALMNG